MIEIIETRKSKLERIVELANELDCLQQEMLNPRGERTYEWFQMLEDIAEEAQSELDKEQ